MFPVGYFGEDINVGLIEAGTVNGRAPVYDGLSVKVGDGILVYSRMVYPPPNTGIFTDIRQTWISSGGYVLLTGLFIGATYDIWRGDYTSSNHTRYRIPETEDELITLPPVLGNDEEDPCV